VGIANECQLENIFSTPTNENSVLPISQKCSFQPVLWIRLDPNLHYNQWIRMQLFTSTWIWIWIQGAKTMQIHANPDPDPG
jgi:hypothetical protein